MWKHRKMVSKLGIVMQLLYGERDLVGSRTISLFPSDTTANWENNFLMSIL